MKKIAIPIVLILALMASLLAGCTTPEPELISREVLFGNPDKASVQLSLDGTKISYLAPVDGVLNVWVGPADDPAAAKPLTNDTDLSLIHISEPTRPY